MNKLIGTEQKLEDFEKILDFQKIIDAIAQKKEDRFHPKMKHKYSPTELSGCIRNSYYSRLFPEAFEDSSYRHFLLGNLLHGLFQDNLESEQRKKYLTKIFDEDTITHIESEKAFQYLIPLEKTNNRRVIISGRLDTIFYLKGYDKPIIVDYKSTQNSYYNAKAPKDEHVDQVNFYLGPSLADYGMVVYIDKRNLSIVQHTLKYSQDRFDKVVKYAVDLDNALETNVVPIVERKVQDEKGNCKYCRHKSRCSEFEKGLTQ